MPYVAVERRLNLGGPLNGWDDDLPLIFNEGIRAVVCLLNIQSDAAVYESAGFEFRCWPVDDGRSPQMSQAFEFVSFVCECVGRNKPVAVFCEAGLGRTGTMIATFLIRSGKSARDAIAFARSKEPSAVETIEQIRFLEEFEKVSGSRDPIVQ